jgi:hypothetical protein
MPARRATEAEVDQWITDGWVLLEGLVGADEIDAVAGDLERHVPTNEAYHADPAGEAQRRKGSPARREETFVWPEGGPGFRPEQQFWSDVFPFRGSGALNRLCVHPMVVDFAERALDSRDLRLYQIHLTAKYEGLTNYEQPLHTDRNHSWLPAVADAPWRNLEGFLYLSDVTAEENPTRMVSLGDSRGVPATTPVLMPDAAPGLYASERPATGVRGSYLAYRSDVFHRGAAFGAARTARFVLALAFKRAGQDWIGYDQAQSRSTGEAGPPDLERRAARRDPGPLPEAGPRPVARRTRRLSPGPGGGGRYPGPSRIRPARTAGRTHEFRFIACIGGP